MLSTWDEAVRPEWIDYNGHLSEAYYVLVLGHATDAAMAASALGTLVWRHPLAEAAQKAVVPLGAAFAFVCLVTGSLWGKPMWGTYWVWDARLTSMLVLFITYLGLLALWHTIEEPGRAARAASVLTLVGETRRSP